MQTEAADLAELLRGLCRPSLTERCYHHLVWEPLLPKEKKRKEKNLNAFILYDWSARLTRGLYAISMRRWLCGDTDRV